MRITLRLILSLVIASSAVVFVSTSYEARQEQVRLQDELERRAAIVADSLQDLAEPLMADPERLAELQRLVERFGNRERLAGVALYAADGQTLALTTNLPRQFHGLPPLAEEAIQVDTAQHGFIQVGEQRWHLFALPMRRDASLLGALVLFHDATYIETHATQLWRQNFVRLLFHVLLISLVTLLIVRWSLIRPMSRTVEWIRRLRTGEPADDALPKEDLFGPLAREVTHMAKSLMAAKAAAEEEARLRHAREAHWTAERLKEHVKSVLQGRTLIVVANREPYQHIREGRHIRWMMPASGLVTAVEPILRACGGTWVAHGSGDADRETADAHGKLKVPPETPAYTLKRVWLSKEEEDGYYYRFANEGLWPLCHIAHTRPIFNADAWAAYQQVNAKFAAAVLEELEGIENPCVLIQDYHFALLPRLIKAARPDAMVALFWHIPWPNPEAFAICPWARDLLDGMLGADLLGFHIQFHCNNFLDTVDRLVESRIDWERFAVNRREQKTLVRPFPISIASEDAEQPSAGSSARPDASTLREGLLKNLGVAAAYLGVGVDRIDYTKGIGERFRAIERFLEQHKEFQGQFTFVELGAPSRTLIKRYHDLGAELDAETERINRRFQTRAWKPIVFLKKHHSHAEIAPFYQAANLCLVTSLHDGMNLVAKEFIAARADAQGVLILSGLTGASRELPEALIVNPYDIDQTADAIHAALTMDEAKQRARMERMRQTIHERNIYRWAADLVSELARIRPDSSRPRVIQAPQTT
ncbi:MAG: trehalose-6-phosphate synthase [Candidatus Omnitrophica bacterium]|nr:trehalose-6-phosphate synthase [Candidatus Omnitrophota bacterium]